MTLETSMKRIFALSVLMLCAATGFAQARTRITDISLDGYCNIYHVRITGVLATAQDTPSCTGNFGGGFVATVKGFGKSVDIALQDSSNPGVQLVLQLSYPFTEGGVFHLYQTTDGINLIDEVDGTYSIAGAAQGPKSARSITSAR
jgi:hypothetical protein